jgi:hypothetical protein
MPASKRQHSGATAAAAADAANANDTIQPKRVSALTLDTCTYLLENISPPFYPQKVLLRRTFFIDPDKTIYVSVGYYPARNYDRCVG